MPMISLTDYSNNYARTSETLWQCYNFDPNDNITQSESFNFQVSITIRTPYSGNTKDVQMAIPLQYLIIFRRTLERSLINCKTNLIACKKDQKIASLPI